MKVAHIITRMIIGGAQENTLLTVEDQYRDYGDDVSLITGPAIGPEGSLLNRAQAGGFELHIIPTMRREIRFFREWRCYRDLVNLLNSIRPQLVHTHSSKAGILGRFAAAKLKIPAVHTIHGASFHVGQNRLFYNTFIALERRAAQHTNRFVSVCDAMTAHYVHAHIAEAQRFTTVYSGMEVEPFLNPDGSRDTTRRKFGFRPDHVVVGKVARLFHLKGHEYLIDSAADVIKRNSNVRFLLVGDGILKPNLEEKIAKLGLSDYFVFTGLVPPDQVPKLIHAMDIVVHTSLWEGLARVLPQALISGKPVISYDVDGAKEVVIPKETGFLLPVKTVEPLADAICESADDANLREKLGSEGRRRFTEQFRHEAMTRRLREVYQNVLDSAG